MDNLGSGRRSLRERNRDRPAQRESGRKKGEWVGKSRKRGGGMVDEERKRVERLVSNNGNKGKLS